MRRPGLQNHMIVSLAAMTTIYIQPEYVASALVVLAGLAAHHFARRWC